MPDNQSPISIALQYTIVITSKQAEFLSAKRSAIALSVMHALNVFGTQSDPPPDQQLLNNTTHVHGHAESCKAYPPDCLCSSSGIDMWYLLNVELVKTCSKQDTEKPTFLRVNVEVLSTKTQSGRRARTLQLTLGGGWLDVFAPQY